MGPPGQARCFALRWTPPAGVSAAPRAWVRAAVWMRRCPGGVRACDRARTVLPPPPAVSAPAARGRGCRRRPSGCSRSSAHRGGGRGPTRGCIARGRARLSGLHPALGSPGGTQPRRRPLGARGSQRALRSPGRGVAAAAFGALARPWRYRHRRAGPERSRVRDRFLPPSCSSLVPSVVRFCSGE